MAAIVDPTVDLTVDVEALLDAPLAELMARAAARRDAAHGAPDHVLAQGVRPAHDAVPRPLRLLHVRQAAGAPRCRPTSTLDEVLAIARRGAALGCHEALFTLGEAPEARYPQPPTGWPTTATPRRSTTSSPRPRLVLDETGLLPHANAGRAHRGRARAAPGGVSPSQGMMIETLAARLGEPGGPHAGAPDKTPERRLATLEAAGRARVPFTTGILVGIGETRAERIEALVAIARRPRAPRPRAGGDRPELPAQAGHRDVARAARAPPTSSSGRSRPPGWCSPVDPPAGAAEPLERRPRARCSRPASTTGAASRRSPSTT